MSLNVLLPVVLSLIVTTAAVLSFVLWSAQGVDERELQRQTALASHVIKTQFARIPKEQQSSTVWDDAIIRTKFSFDLDWIDLNLGAWISSYYGHDSVVLLDARDRPIYAASDGQRIDVTRGAPLLADLQPMVHQMRAGIKAGALDAFLNGSAPNSPSVVALASVEGVAALVSVTPITSDTGEILQDRGTEYLHVSVLHLDQDYAQRLGAEFQIPDLRFSGAPPTGENRAVLPLTDNAGRIIAFLDWAQSSPGRAILNQTLPAIAAAFLVAGLISITLIDQLRRKSRALETGRADAERQAAHDQLTNLPNRMTFEKILTRVLAQRPSHDWRVAVLMLDLDRFKLVNDTLGHRAGDDLIRAVGQRLGQLIRPSDMLARLGGDEFAIIQIHSPGPAEPITLSREIIDAIGKPFDIVGSEAFVGVSIGIAAAEGNETDAYELARKADIALYEAKAGGRNRAIVFEEPMNQLLQNRKTIEAELREALRRSDQLSVAFQPLFSADKSIVGAEALARWSHPSLGQISPAHFIPVAEASGLIDKLGAFVLRQACELGAKWPGYTFAVNISPAQLRDPHFPSQVFELLAQTGMRPADLELEITEGILLEEASDAAAALRVFRAAGIKVALDDFGTGYSSLNYLKRYPVDRIKIDRSFVSQLTPGDVSVAIVQAMVTLAHALEIDVTAEGVETREQMDVLRGLGCNIYQGFLLSAPIAPAALERQFDQPLVRVA